MCNVKRLKFFNQGLVLYDLKFLDVMVVYRNFVEIKNGSKEVFNGY